MTDCIFCKIVARDIPADIVYENDDVLAFRDINAQAPTHVQIIPKKHVAKIADFEASEDTGWLVALFEAAKEIASQEGLDKGFRLVFNNGALSGQSVLHVHMHILGGRQLAWPPG
jgi:histidine triad (HIT) family protein